MSWTKKAILDLAATLDGQGRPNQPILVGVKRRTAMKWFKAKKRGGPVFVGEHPLQHVGRHIVATEQQELPL